MKSALSKFNGKESMTMVLVINDDLQKMLAGIPNAGAAASKIATLTTSLTITNSIAFNMAGVTGDAKSAKNLSAVITALKAAGVALLADNEQIPPIAIEILETIKVSASQEAVLVDLKVTKEMLDKAAKGGKDK